MKRPSREINIFSMSALDLFASAMGAFILLTVILFPYYQKNAKIVEELNKIKNTLAKTQQQLTTCQTQQQKIQNRLQTCEQKRQECEQQKQACENKLKQTFLAIVLKWTTLKQDVDLHVIDTEGNEFYYSTHNRERNDFPNSDAELSVDTTQGPGIEIWENPLAKTGDYKIYINLYTRHGNAKNPTVKTTVYYRDGSKKMHDVTLSTEGHKVLVATVNVNSEGDVTVASP